MIRQYELVERVKAYDPDADEDLINRAYVFSMKVHGTQKRASGDPYFLHPLEVAGILADMKMDTGSIVTGLLHDTVEDTVTTLGDVEAQFGPEVARLVNGVTKLSSLEQQSDQSSQAENFRKLVLAMSKDIRVLLVKLCDRLHNMRTLGAIKDEDKRRRIARETLEIYAPLAERIGMHEMKDELEDLAFLYLNADAHDSIVRRLAQLRAEDSDTITEVIAELKQVLADNGLNAVITGREKRPYSIWRKMQVRNVPFEQMADIMAFRIIVDTVGDCYQALGLIHGRYSSLLGRFKDYISTPKPNGYQSLHTAVIGPFRQRIEVQIRSHQMHEVAELGVAAHWIYKQGKRSKAGYEQPPYRWLRELLDIVESAQKPEEFLEHTKLELFQDQVFCFTPKGMLVALPQGATPIDFAYAVHSQVGDTCVGAKVNGRMVTLRSTLENGDQVEIVTSKTSTPSPEWLRFAVTGKARSRVRRFIRQKQRAEYAQLGRAMLQKLFRQEGYDYTERAVEGVTKAFKVAHSDDLCANVGSGVTPARDVFNAVFPGHRAAVHQRDENVVPLARARGKLAKPKSNAVAIRGLIPGMAVHYARCCHPIPGDRVVGIVTTGKGVTIHTIDCETLDSFYDQPERWLDVSWDAEAEDAEDHVGRLAAVIANEPGSLGTLTTVIGKNGGNITNLRFTHRSTDFFELLVDISVKDVKHLTNIIAALRATPVISSVERARSG